MRLLVSVTFVVLSSGLFGLTIVGSSNRAGEIEPCGCQVNQVGGLNRMAEWISDRRKVDSVWLAEAGDTFFSGPSVAETRVPMEKLRAVTLAAAFKEMGLLAMTPGERDLALGLDFYRELAERSGATVVITNLKESRPTWIVPSLLKSEKDHKVLFVGLVPEDLFGEPVKVKNPIESLEEILGASHLEASDQVIVLSHLGLNEDRKIIAKFKGLTVISAHSLDSVVEENAETKSKVAQPQHEGQQIVVVTAEGVKLVDLGKSWDKENRVAKLVRHYHEVRGIAQAKEKTQTVSATKGRPYVANPSKCKKCHEDQYRFWESTKHSSSILVLYAKKQHLASECIGCHSLGYRKPGGFESAGKALVLSKTGSSQEEVLREIFHGDEEGALDSRTSPERYSKLKARYHKTVGTLFDKANGSKLYWGTQCEHCHGNRNGHPNGALTQKRVTAETCIQCHRPPNAPEFDLAMMNKIACPPMKR